jgi:hypothetical protein
MVVFVAEIENASAQDALEKELVTLFEAYAFVLK